MRVITLEPLRFSMARRAWARCIASSLCWRRGWMLERMKKSHRTSRALISVRLRGH
jgi:hypothetical protein